MKGKVCGDFCEFTLDKGHFITGEKMKNANIAKVLKEYRKRNQLSVTDVSIQLSEKSVPEAPGNAGSNTEIIEFILKVLSSRQQKIPDT